MKFIIALLVIALLIAIVLTAVAFLTEGYEGVQKMWRKRKQKTGLWRRSEETDEEQIIVYCIEPGTERKLLVGAAPFAAEDFDLQVELLRNQARIKLVALNRERKELKR